MEISCRYIPIQIARLEGREVLIGSKPALCFRDKETAFGIINDDEMIRPILLTLRIHDESQFVLYDREEYPVHKFVAHLQRIMLVKPITPQAKALLDQLTQDPEGELPIHSDSTPKVRKGQTSSPVSIIGYIATELEVQPARIRKFLRSQGMHSPYTDEKAIRTLMRTYS